MTDPQAPEAYEFTPPIHWDLDLEGPDIPHLIEQLRWVRTNHEVGRARLAAAQLLWELEGDDKALRLERALREFDD